MSRGKNVAEAVKIPVKIVNFTIINRLDIKQGYIGCVRCF